MKITVTDGKISKTHNFREGLRASELIADMGFDFPMPCGGLGRCGKCMCKINGREAAACKTLVFSDSVIEIEDSSAAVLTADETVAGAEGTVIDIGTTTVAAAFFENGVPVKTIGVKNPQCGFGADVISRIGAKNTAPLTKAIRDLIGEIRRDFGGRTVITGNTAMLALLCGEDVSGMGVYPFKMPSKFDLEYDGAYLPPCLSAFVGADALCSLLRSGAAGKAETAMVMDLGTNGEICLKHGDKIYFTSAAAGPALEGANISRGMAAGEGAIYRADGNGYEVMGGTKARGICGSGLVDVIALMLRSGAMDSYGTIEKDYEIYDSGIFITQEDVRAYQLCKAAISAAAKTLAKKCGLSFDDVDRIYLSGALGKNIDIKNAVITGLLPKTAAEKFVPIGNGSLLGGAMLLIEENRERLRRLADGCEAVNLAADVDFMESYIAEMNF
ncbi:MAG: ASKHA domain-containing protein [Clostridia bacterium]